MSTNPATSAMPYLQQIPSTISPYYQPYINAGSSSLNQLMGQYTNLLTNPSMMLNNIGSGYTQSPGYQSQYNQAMNASNQSAAAGGMLGTPENQQQSAQMATDLANQDYWNYMNHALGLYQTGLSGEQGINQMGYGASNELANSLANNLQSEAGLTYAGQSEQNKIDAMNKASQDQMWGSLLGGAMSFL